MMPANSLDPAIRRREAGDFLRSRRERLSPEIVGLPGGFRRRTPGLRREEVALLANVGITWYTWLEQGREVQPSTETLSAIADALRLDGSERDHLFVLHHRSAPRSPQADVERIGAPLRRMLDSLTGQPALVLGRRWDILAWNAAAEAVYGPYGRLRDDERNALYLLFANADHRSLLVDWEAVARNALAMFRVDFGRHADDPGFAELIDRLAGSSSAFTEWWSMREVLQPVLGHKRIDHPEAGRMIFEYSSFGVGDQPDMKLIVFTPLTDDDTIGKLECLLRDRTR